MTALTGWICDRSVLEILSHVERVSAVTIMQLYNRLIVQLYNHLIFYILN